MSEPGGSSVLCKVSGKKPNLPYGWIVKQSSSYPDRVYFFNTLTGATSWEAPVLVPGASANNLMTRPGNSIAQPPISVGIPEFQTKTIFESPQNPSQDASRLPPFQMRSPQPNRRPPIQFPILNIHKPSPSISTNALLPNITNQTSTKRNPYNGKLGNQQPSFNLPPPRFKQLGSYSSQRGNGAGQSILSDDTESPARVNERYPDKKNIGSGHLFDRGYQKKNKMNYNQKSSENVIAPSFAQDHGKVKKKSKSKRKGKKQSPFSQNKQRPPSAQGAGFSGVCQDSVSPQGIPSNRSIPCTAESRIVSGSKGGNPVCKLLKGEDIIGNFSPTLDDYDSDLEDWVESPPSLEAQDWSIPEPSVDFNNRNIQSPTDSDFLGSSTSKSLSPANEVILMAAETWTGDTRQVKCQHSHKPVLFNRAPPWKNPRDKVTLLEIPKPRPCHPLLPAQSPGITMAYRSNPIWATHNTGILSNKRTQPYDPNLPHVRPREIRQESISRFLESPQAGLSTTLQTQSVEPKSEKVIQGKISPILFNSKEEFGHEKLSTRQKVGKRKLELNDTCWTTSKKKIISYDKKSANLIVDSLDGNVPSKSKTPKLTLSSADSAESKRLVNVTLNLGRKTSRFSLSSMDVPSESQSTRRERSPVSRKRSKQQNKKRVRLKRITVEGQTDSVNETEKLSERLDTKTVDDDGIPEVAHISDLYKYASIQSWVNLIEHPAPPVSSPDTTLSGGSASIEFKTPIETVSSGQDHPEPDAPQLGRSFSDSGYSTSTLEKGLNGPVKIPSEMREIVGMEVDSEQAQNNAPKEVDRCKSTLLDSPNPYCGKLTEDFGGTMEVQVSEQPTGDNQTSKLFVVVDTNILIHHLPFLEEFRDTNIKGFGRPFLVIPWVVLQELDGLKNSDQNMSNRTWASYKKVRAPVRFLYSCFKSKHPRVIGQSSQEAKTNPSQLDVECNDDRVLQCCIQWKDKYFNSQVILLSDDLNLISKSTVSNIRAFNRQDLLAGIQSLVTESFVEEPALETSRNVSFPVPSTPELPQTPMISTREVTPDVTKALMKNRETAIQLADDIVCELKSLLKNILAVVLETEMKSIYEELWLEIVFRKPPWTLTTLLECYEKHWIAVFGDLLQRKTISYFRQLSKNFKDGSGYGSNIRQVCCLLDDSLAVLQSLPSKNNYSLMAKKPLGELKQLQVLCTQILTGQVQVCDVPSLDVYLGRKTTPVQITSPAQYPDSSLDVPRAEKDTEDTSSNPSSQNNNNLTEADCTRVFQKFNNTWEAINHFVDQMKRQVLAGALDEVCAQVAQRLPVLRQVRKFFYSALSVKRSRVRERSEEIRQLCSALNTLVTTSNNNNNNLEVEKLILFFSTKANRPLLQAGLKQLDEMILGLYTCVKKELELKVM